MALRVPAGRAGVFFMKYSFLGTGATRLPAVGAFREHCDKADMLRCKSGIFPHQARRESRLWRHLANNTAYELISAVYRRHKLLLG